MKVFAATGHRPNKLGGYTQELADIRYDMARNFLKINEPETCISGMALGWDTDFALASLSLNIPLVAAIPFDGQESRWPETSKEIYFNILDRASKIVYTSEPGYATWKMQVRNEMMVDECTALIALWDGSDGGTGNCIAYAKQRGRKIYNLWSTYEPLMKQFKEIGENKWQY